MTESWASSAGARATMRANRSRDTKPELLVRRLVHAAGLRYRVSAKPEKDLRRTADLLLGPARVAVFIDGYFWHGCPEHYIAPKANDSYWGQKVARNRKRDLETTSVLTERGWTVLRFWEHEDPAGVAQTVIDAVRSRRPAPRAAPDPSPLLPSTPSPGTPSPTPLASSPPRA
ncbi:very short patch repair endonuclease [Micrococcus sp. M4NT]|uniref:very short patch repair endonuclease n=1 Tax=Micrococcus sp. M4NT TaxID=2957501 RepID=UPI0029BF581E|nr:very short patch repair endonuclease [Micrococcus sp. M4NT]MDX2340550.1 very short patch repair endonuclease [Micrococcus sp. M4NT]